MDRDIRPILTRIGRVNPKQYEGNPTEEFQKMIPELAGEAHLSTADVENLECLIGHFVGLLSQAAIVGPDVLMIVIDDLVYAMLVAHNLGRQSASGEIAKPTYREDGQCACSICAVIRKRQAQPQGIVSPSFSERGN
jgi:hypothetical protein